MPRRANKIVEDGEEENDEETEGNPRPSRSQGAGDDNLAYDPNQNAEVKRQLRRDYRRLGEDGGLSSCLKP